MQTNTPTETRKSRTRRPVAGVWIRAGSVPVDSGQLMVIDPCYVEDGFATEHDATPTGVNYAGACKASLSSKRCGAMRSNAMPLGFCASSGYGDGVYPVFVKYNADGRIVGIRIDCE